MSQYFIYYRNFTTKIQIIFDIYYILDANFCNYHTILYLFNSMFDVEIPNIHHFTVCNSLPNQIKSNIIQRFGEKVFDQVHWASICNKPIFHDL